MLPYFSALQSYIELGQCFTCIEHTRTSDLFVLDFKTCLTVLKFLVARNRAQLLTALSRSRIFIKDVGGSHLWEGQGTRLWGRVRNDAPSSSAELSSEASLGTHSSLGLISRILDAGHGLWSGQLCLLLGSSPAPCISSHSLHGSQSDL